MHTTFFTGKGDGGESVVGGKKIKKDNPILGFLGSLDELNSVIGWCRVASSESKVQNKEISYEQTLVRIQEMLFIAQAEIAGALFGYPASKKITEEHTEYFETLIRRIDVIIPPIKKFIIPGGSELSSRIDIARAISRRVERDAIIMSKDFNTSLEMKAFLNRLSSVLFALARYANLIYGVEEKNPSYK